MWKKINTKFIQTIKLNYRCTNLSPWKIARYDGAHTGVRFVNWFGRLVESLGFMFTWGVEWKRAILCHNNSRFGSCHASISPAIDRSMHNATSIVAPAKSCMYNVQNHKTETQTQTDTVYHEKQAMSSFVCGIFIPLTMWQNNDTEKESESKKIGYKFPNNKQQ